MSLLDLFLKKKGISGYEQLTAEERAVFQKWSDELAGKPITIEGLKDFLKSQQTINLSEFENFENDPKKDLFLKVYSRICRQIVYFIETPEKVRKIREDALKEQIDGSIPGIH